jgi:mRNA interferase MazF
MTGFEERDIVAVDWRRNGLPNKQHPGIVVKAPLFVAEKPHVILVPLTDNPRLVNPGEAVAVQPNAKNGLAKPSWALSHFAICIVTTRLQHTQSRITAEQLAEIRRQILQSSSARLMRDHWTLEEAGLLRQEIRAAARPVTLQHDVADADVLLQCWRQDQHCGQLRLWRQALLQTVNGRYLLLRWRQDKPAELEVTPLQMHHALAWMERVTCGSADIIERLFGEMPDVGSPEAQRRARQPRPRFGGPAVTEDIQISVDADLRAEAAAADLSVAQLIEQLVTQLLTKRHNR